MHWIIIILFKISCKFVDSVVEGRSGHKEKKREVQKEYQYWLYLNVYAPIYKIMNTNVLPGCVYEGIDIDSGNNIIENYNDLKKKLFM